MSRDKEKDKIIVDRLINEIRARGIKFAHIDVNEESTKELGETLFIEVSVYTTENFTVNDMLELNFDLMNKYQTYDQKILFFLHAY
jgi:hypothetical protein